MEKIIKRDGRIVDFDISKIENAIVKAMMSLGEGDVRDARKLAKITELELAEKFEEKLPSVEDIQDIVEKVRGTMPGEDTLYDLTELFRIFADSTRVRILYVLEESEMCVCDLAALLGMTQSAISHQLRALKNARLVKARRDGKTVFYSLADQHVKTILDQGLEHISE